MMVVEGWLATELERKARSVAPEEAVGLLTTDGRVIMLPNRASKPQANFEILKSDIFSAIRMHELENVVELTLWHSHPNGGVGPSKVDMQQRLPFFDHLVVTLHSADVEFTWY